MSLLETVKGRELLTSIEEGGADVFVVMGSTTDWHENEKDGTWRCCQVLGELGVTYKTLVLSAHRTPHRMYHAALLINGKVKVVIAAAGGAAHLPGMMAAFMFETPVIGLPMKSSTLNGVDSLYSIVQMPPGVPVATMAIGGAENAAILAATIVGLVRPEVMNRVSDYRQKITDGVPNFPA